MSAPLAAVAVEGADLELGSGLLALVRPALDLLGPGGVLAVLSSAPSVAEDLPAWCRLERHRHVGSEADGEGRWRHLIEAGRDSMSTATHAGVHVERRSGRLLAADVLDALPMPATADAGTGFAPRGTRVEAGGPRYPFSLLERDHVAPPEIAELYDQAVGAQWDATRDIPWDEVGRLEPAVEAATCQIMTFLAENELSALYVPAKFLPRIHPAYAEVAMFLATQLADEARHIDAFLKRARAFGGPAGVSSATTSRSLLSLLELSDFTEVAFLLSVLGEGTFLDLLRFIEEHACDAATREVARRARGDEARHVHFGLAHVRHALGHEPALASSLEAAVRRRSAALAGVSGVPAPLQDALTVLAAGGTSAAAIRRGHAAFQGLLHDMHDGRVKRLRHAGFTSDQAQVLSDLHTPNFM